MSSAQMRSSQRAHTHAHTHMHMNTRTRTRAKESDLSRADACIRERGDKSSVPDPFLIVEQRAVEVDRRRR